MSSVAAPHGATTALLDLDAITDEERLRSMWQTAEDFGDRRRIRARMYRLREQRLREMMQNDEESLGTLNIAEDDPNSFQSMETTITVTDDGKKTTRRSSNIQVTMHMDGDKAVTDSISTQNVRLGGLTMRGIDADDIIQERIQKASKDRTARYQIIKDLSDNDGHSDGDAVVSITKSTYSIQSNALAGEGYISMKNKEVRDSVSPTRIMRERRSSAEEDASANEGRLTSDDEAVLKTESENVIKALETSVPKTTSSSRKTSREERTSTTRTSTKTRQSEIPVRKESTRKISERKTSRELDLSSAKRTTMEKSSPTSPTKRTPGEATTRTSLKTGSQREATTTGSKTTSKSSSRTTSSTRKDKLAEIEAKMETSIMSELDKLDSYLNASVDDDDEIIMEEEEDCVDESGNVVKMLVQTRRKKDGTECTARRVARSTKIVNSESEIDEILIGNPEHEVIERNVAEEEDKEGNKIKIITETRQRPDGIVYTTKNILKTSKIFDYDHPEDIAYSEEDELISTDQTEETDENGCKIQTVTETRRKANGVEYTTKKVYKTSKVKSTQLTPCDDDEIIDTKETEEKKEDGTIIRTVIETRRTKNGEEYTHRQVLKSRRMTLSGVDVQKGLPTMQNDDEILDKKEKEEIDENGMKIRIVTETRKRQDGSTYSFDYVLRSFQGTEEEMQNMPITASSGNIAVSAEDELLNEEVKEEVQEDGSTVKTIIERRRAKDGTEYLRHRVMRIPKMPEPVFTVANLEDEVLREEVNEETLDDGTQYKAVTERRRSSVSGVQYTLRRMSRVYQQPAIHPKANEDEILDENVAEEETDDGTIIKTIIQRYQRPDGSVYTTHNIHKMFSSPAPVTFVGTEDDELVDQTVDEQETEDGCIIKTVTETRRRADGVQYTVERAEKSTKFGPQVHVTFNANQPRKPEDVVQVGSPEDTVVSSEEQEYQEEDGTTVKTTIEVRRRVDGTEYTAKTILRSTPVLVPERETSYVVIKPEGGDEEDESGLFPSLDDEIVYTRKREDKDAYGNPITVVIETRQTKSGEKYNITKRVHTKDVLLTEEGEKEIPRKTMKSTLVANLKTRSTPDQKKPSPSETTEDTQDDVPYGSVTALKNRFAPVNKKPDSSPTPKYTKPDRLNTSNKKKFFEDAAKEASGKVTTSKSFTPKPLKIKKDIEEDRVDKASYISKDKASIEVKLRVEDEKVQVEDVEARNLTYHTDSKTPGDTVKERDLEGQQGPEDLEHFENEPETVDEPKEESSEPEPDVGDSSPAEEEPQEIKPKKVEKTKKPSPVSKKAEEKPRRRQDLSPKKKPEPTGSPTRRTPSNREPITPKESPRRAPKPINTSPQRVPSSPRRGRSPNRSGVSTPREVTPTGRNCCKRHREANANASAPESVSPTRTQKSPRSTVPTSKKPGSPEGKPRMNGDIKRSPEPKMNGDVSRKPDDRTSRTRRPLDRTNEPEKTTTRPSRLNQSPRKSPTSKSPEKREPTRPLSTRGSDKKVPSKSVDSEPKGKPKSSSLNIPEPADPVVSLPETPMTEGVKPLPVDDDDEDFVIEDVSNEPDLPYHKIHRPSLVREPSEYPDVDGEGEQPDDAFVEESPDERDEKEPVKEDIVKSRKPKPLESRPSDKSLTSKKQPESKRPVRDRPWLTEKRNSFEKKPSETKLSADKKKLFERKPSDDKLKKPKEEKKPTKKTHPEDSSPSEDEGVENGIPETEDAPSQELPDSNENISKKAEEISSRLLEDLEKSIESEIITEKNVSTTEVSAKRSMFSRPSPDKKKDTPTRKPSYEIKESIFAKRSMFEQSKKDPVPSPLRRPTLKTTKKDDSYKKPEEPKPVKEPLIVPKYFHPLGEDGDEPEKKVVEEEVKLSSSKLVMNASAEITKTTKKSDLQKPVDDGDDDEDQLTLLKKQRSPSPFSKESSPAPRSKEGSPSPFRKEGSPTRFATGRPVDSGINADKIRRIERTASNKKLFEDLEVSRETLPEYIKNIDNILDVVVLESMLEQAQTYEERRLIRGQIRIAKKQSTTTTSSTTTSHKRVVDSTPSRPGTTASPQPPRREDPKPHRDAKPRDSSNLTETSSKPLSKYEDSQPSPRDDSLPDDEEPMSPRRKVSAAEEPAPEPVHETRGPSRFGRRTFRDPSPEPRDIQDSPRSRRSDDDEVSFPREPVHETRGPSRFGRRTFRDPSPEPRDIQDSPRSRRSDDDEVSFPREPKREVKPEEPRKYESSPSKTRETPRSSRFQPVTSKAAPSNEPYSEPLRYQKKLGGSTPSKPAAAQSDVDKIVSAYGVGPTDDNGMPLFGLRALKKRSPAAAPAESTPKEEDKPSPSVTETPEQGAPDDQGYEPTDASGQPIFGLRALKKAATSSVTATEKAIERSEVQETRETASSSVVESSRLVSGIVTQRQTHASK